MPVGKTSGIAKYTAPAPQQTQTVNGGALAGDFTEFLKLVAKSPALITGYSKVLKAAGYYKGKINGKYNIGLQEALTRAETERASINLISPITRDQFFAQLEPVSTGAAAGPSTVTSVSKYTPESAQQVINAIIQDTLGRKATAAEVKKYTSTLKNIEKQASTITKYSGAGASQTQTTTRGINEQQYLLDQISGTDEGKANKVLGFYETFMNALGAK